MRGGGGDEGGHLDWLRWRFTTARTIWWRGRCQERRKIGRCSGESTVARGERLDDVVERAL